MNILYACLCECEYACLLHRDRRVYDSVKRTQKCGDVHLLQTSAVGTTFLKGSELSYRILFCWRERYISCMGGAMAPLSSSSSESALGLLSDLVTAWFSIDPLPSPPASGWRPVISSTAASTAVGTENACESGGLNAISTLKTHRRRTQVFHWSRGTDGPPD